jgi:hypothetical protein
MSDPVTPSYKMPWQDAPLSIYDIIISDAVAIGGSAVENPSVSASHNPLKSLKDEPLEKRAFVTGPCHSRPPWWPAAALAAADIADVERLIARQTRRLAELG